MKRSFAEHSLEEIRSATLAVLKKNVIYYRQEKMQSSGAYQFHHGIHEFLKLRAAVAAEINQSEGRGTATSPVYDQGYIDRDNFVEVFWELFRDGIITLGQDENNVNFPYFRLTQNGFRFVENELDYFIKDLGNFEQHLKQQLPQIDEISLIYMKEAMQAFRAGCRISSAVMLGVASEHVFLTLIETIDNNPTERVKFSKVGAERQISGKINKFKAIVEANRSDFSKSLLEGFDTEFLGIQQLIRAYRNEAGHPSGYIPTREQAFVNIQLFVPYCKKLHAFMAHFA